MDTKYSNLLLVPIGLGSVYIISNTNPNYVIDNTTILPFSVSILAIFYFVIDFYLMIKNYDPRNKVYFMHHLIGIFSIICVYFKYNNLSTYLFSYLTFELSTPFLNSTKYFYKRRSYYLFNLAYIISVVMFFIIFTIVRIIFGTYLLYQTIPVIYNLSGHQKILVLLPSILQLLNYIWYYKIIKMLYN
ncbi:putative TLC domain-containing protein [Powai lake megavirus]|uniref:Putative TLC domain-containing protein n=1 Tax=Powai lake megavirus TaxID=1842663 RepID=A0A167RDP0_9VIRU|nr:putative TLC domain-containing protein [Powai lake megavirus]ANB50565.1 putative TLC domain-containing protein [Powai lake megavirus]